MWFFSRGTFLLSCQSYDAKFLKIYPELSPTPLQLEEDLEQLKVLENGYKMKVSNSHVYDILFVLLPIQSIMCHLYRSTSPWHHF